MDDVLNSAMTHEIRAAAAAADYRSSMPDDMKASVNATLDDANGLPIPLNGITGHLHDPTEEAAAWLPVRFADIPPTVFAANHYRSRAFDLMRANVNATMDFAQRLAEARSTAEFIAVTTSQARAHVEMMVSQTKALVVLAHVLAAVNLEQMAVHVAKAYARREA